MGYCTCTMTPESEWRSTASYGYVGGLSESGSQWDRDPDCPEHGGWGCCNTCKGTGRTYTPETGGMCADCRGTGHPHEGVCAAAWADRYNEAGVGNIPLPDAEWCAECGRPAVIVDEFDDEQIIPDRRISGPPSFRAYHVTALECGHEIAEAR